MSKAAIDRFVAGVLGGPAASTPILLWGFGAAILVLLVFAVVNLMVIRSRVRVLAATLADRDKKVASVSAEMEAQAMLARQMSIDVEELRKRLADHHEPVRPDPPAWGAPGGPLNLNRRGQILRLSRKGKSIAEIAQDLNVPQGEVDLMLKVHDLSQKSPIPEN